MILRLLKKVARTQSVDNIEDATIDGNNLDGTYDIKLRSGALKRKAVNMTESAFNIGDVVNITMVGGNHEMAKIVGRGMRKKGNQKIVVV